MNPLHAIPTTYRGVNFRSRLEAKWASFFDALHWRWEYEPLDLAGYIPDFILPFKHAPLLVEVKPAMQRSELEEYTKKIEESGWTGEALIVGARIFDAHDLGPDYPAIGLLGERISYQGIVGDWRECACLPLDVLEDAARDPRNGTVEVIEECVWDAGLLFECTKCKCVSIHHNSMSWRCRVNGCYDGDHYLGGVPDWLTLWHDAGNNVQWRAVQPSPFPRRRHRR